MFSNHTTVVLKENFSPSLWVGWTFEISNVLEDDTTLDTSWETCSFVFKDTSFQLERFEITATGWVATVVRRWLTRSSPQTEDANLKKQWNDGAIWYITILADDQIDKQNAKPDRLTLPVVADTTARDALYTTPAWWEIVEVTSLWGATQKYNAVTAQWETFDIWTPPVNATEIAAGIIELPTDAEFTAKTALWTTWASLSPTNAQIWKSVALKVVDATMAETDHIVFDKAWTDNKMLKSVLRDQLAATELLKGTSKKASAAEALAWTNDTNHTTPLHLPKYETIIISRALATAWWTVNYSHNLGRKPKLIMFNTSPATNSINQCWWAYDWTNNRCTYVDDSFIPFSFQDTSHCMNFEGISSNAVASVTATSTTEFTLTWVQWGSAVTSYISVVLIW